MKLPTEKEINKRLEEVRKLEQDQRLAEQKDIKIEDLVETERARADKEGTKDFEQDNYDFEVPTIKLSIKNFVDNRMKTVLDASVKKEGFKKGQNQRRQNKNVKTNKKIRSGQQG